MDRYENLYLGHIGGILSMNECECAATNSNARVGGRRQVPVMEGCYFFGATPLAPSHSNAAPRT
jgi:hypothetical protein